MKLKKLAVLTTLLAIGGVLAVAAQAVVHTTVLSGTVTKVVAPGTAVREGDTLVEVDSLAGSMPAARATVDGTVVQTDVEVGQKIEQGREVAVVETK